ncbi:MAG: hypothetical protein U0931_42280, partial [Vulcanimicrobiota bacterium]
AIWLGSMDHLGRRRGLQVAESRNYVNPYLGGTPGTNLVRFNCLQCHVPQALENPGKAWSGGAKSSERNGRQ